MRARSNTSTEDGAASGTQRLLQAAIELFGRDGFDGTSVRDIAERAGVSFALIRASYGSKEGLLKAAEKLVFEDSLPLWNYSGALSSAEEVKAFMRSQAAEFAHIASHAEFIRRAILERRPAANAFMARMLVNQGEGGHALQRAHPNEPWLQNPLRQLWMRLGYFLIAPNVREILGIDMMSPEFLERINVEETRFWELVEKGLASEEAEAATDAPERPGSPSPRR